ncbi:hypothetical protein KGP36_07895 [Patescibacteria group bacterium]|nr:hypothetical protein [Patescibacteria group bacterium]
MKPTVCICCGEEMSARPENSRNPNMCESCSSLEDGMAGAPNNLPPEAVQANNHNPIRRAA